MIKRKLSEKEKYEKDGEWFKNMMNYFCPYSLHLDEDHQEMQVCYQVVNNDLSSFKERLKQFCNPLGDGIEVADHEIEPYPELHNCVNILKGEMIGRKDTLNLLLLTSKAIQDKNQQLIDAIRLSVDEKVAIELDKQQMQLQQMSEEEIAKYQEELRTQLEPEDLLSKNWQSEIEIFFNKALKYVMHDQSILDKKVDTFEDIIIADRCFIFSGWKHGKPFLEVRNPLRVLFHKNPNEKRIEKSDWIAYRKTITLTEAVDTYNLSEDDVAKLGIFSHVGKLDARHDIFSNDSKPVWDHTRQEMLLQSQSNSSDFDKQVGLNQTGYSSLSGRRELIFETHFEFKAFKEIIFLSYKDEYNNPIVLPLSSDFEIPKHATKEKFYNRYDMESIRHSWFDELTQTQFSAESLWVPRKYEIVRLGSDVYPVMREVPYQHTSIEQPYTNFELSTKGMVLNARNARSVSPIQRALPIYFQYLYTKSIQNRELSKYQGAIQAVDVDQIPDSLGQDLEGNPIRDKVSAYLAMLRKTNKDFFSGSQTSLGGLPPSTRSPGSSGYMLGTAVELLNLQSLLDFLKREIGMAMGISPQRQSNFQTNSNVADNQQAINQSYAITEPYFYNHSMIWKAALNDWLINFKTYCKNQFELHDQQELSFHYWLPNNTEEVLKVTPNSLQHSDIGLFLANSSNAEKYAQYMLEYSHAFAQNQGEGATVVSGIIKDIVMGASPEEIHKRIQIEEKKQQERQQQMQQSQFDSQEQLQKMQIEAREDEQAFAIQLEELKNKGKLDVALVTSYIGQKDQDQDDDGVPDQLEILKLQQKVALDNQKISLEKEKLQYEKEYDKEKLAIERKKAGRPKSTK